MQAYEHATGDTRVIVDHLLAGTNCVTLRMIAAGFDKYLN